MFFVNAVIATPDFDEALAQIQQEENTHLELELDNNFSPEQINALLRTAFANPHVEGLMLVGAPIAPSFLKTLEKGLAQKTAINFSFGMRDTQFAPPEDAIAALGAENIAAVIKLVNIEHKTELAKVLARSPITELYFSQNKLGPEGAILFAQILSTSPTLSGLDMDDNDIGAQACAVVVNTLDNGRLTTLSLGINHIGYVSSDINGIDVFAQTIQNRTLVNLNLHGNNLRWYATTLTNALDKLPSLRALCLSNNHINAPTATQIIQQCSAHKCLSALDLANNSIVKTSELMSVTAQADINGLTTSFANNFRESNLQRAMQRVLDDSRGPEIVQRSVAPDSDDDIDIDMPSIVRALVSPSRVSPNVDDRKSPDPYDVFRNNSPGLLFPRRTPSPVAPRGQRGHTELGATTPSRRNNTSPSV